jgi:hypothetical protein
VTRRDASIRAAAWALIGAAWIWIYGELVQLDPLLERDDLHILSRVRDPGDWAALLTSSTAWRALVYQPLRDLSLLLNRSLEAATGWGGYHALNLALFAALCALVARAWRAGWGVRGVSGAWLLCAYALHPVFVASAGWVSARKHLMAAVFLAAATALVVTRGRRGRDARSRLAVAAYAASVLSHPIGVAWPLWWAWRSPRGSVSRRTAAILVALAALTGLANLVYYAGEYVAHVGAPKLEPWGWDLTGAVPAAVARYLHNFIAPYALAATYHPASANGIVATILLPAWFWAAWRVARADRRARDGLALAGLALAPVTLLMTKVFVSDTYALAASLGLFGFVARAGRLAARTAGRREVRVPRGAARAAALITLAVLVTLSARQAEAWRSDAALWERSAAVEPAPRNLLGAARYRIAAGDASGAYELASAALAWNPADGEAATLLARVLYERGEGLSDRERTELEAWSAFSAWAEFYRAAIRVRSGEMAPAIAAIPSIVRRCAEFGVEWERVREDLRAMCRAAGSADCDPQPPADCAR